MTLNITMICHCAECRILFIIMLSVVMLNVAVPSVAAPSKPFSSADSYFFHPHKVKETFFRCCI
jgi:hypothetical protein